MIGAIDVPQIIHKIHSTNRTIVSSWLCLPNFEYFFLFFCLRFWRLCFFWCAHFFNDLLGLSFRWCNFFPEIVTVRDVVDKGLGQTVIFVHIFPLNIWEIGSLIGMKIEHWNHRAGNIVWICFWTNVLHILFWQFGQQIVMDFLEVATPSLWH